MIFKFVIVIIILLVINILSIKLPSNYKFITGILMNLPAMTAASYWIMSENMNRVELKDSILSSIWSLPLLVIFMISVYLYSLYFSGKLSIVLGLVTWLVFASIFVIVKFRV